MTRDDIIRMAREATDHLPDADSIRLQGIVLLAFDAGAAAERDGCIVELERNADKTLEEIVAAIRARGQG